MGCVLWTLALRTFLHGHFVGRCWDRLQWRTRKWKGFLHLLCNAVSCNSCFFLFDFLNLLFFLFSGAIFQYSELSCCLFVQMRNPAKNRDRLISRRASSRCSKPDSFSNVLSWFGRIPKMPKKHKCGWPCGLIQQDGLDGAHWSGCFWGKSVVEIYSWTRV